MSRTSSSRQKTRGRRRRHRLLLLLRQRGLPSARPLAGGALYLSEGLSSRRPREGEQEGRRRGEQQAHSTSRPLLLHSYIAAHRTLPPVGMATMPHAAPSPLLLQQPFTAPWSSIADTAL